MKVFYEIVGGIISHIVIVAILGFIGLFVWNTGVTGLLPNLHKIEYKTATAIMLGIYVINIFLKSWHKRFTAHKLEQMAMEKLFSKKDNIGRK